MPIHVAGRRTVVWQANGVLTGRALQEASAQLQGHEKPFLAMLKARTQLTEGEAPSFVHRTIIWSANEARRDGVTDGTEEVMLPKDVVIAAIATKAAPKAESSAPPAAFNGCAFGLSLRGGRAARISRGVSAPGLEQGMPGRDACAAGQPGPGRFPAGGPNAQDEDQELR